MCMMSPEKRSVRTETCGWKCQDCTAIPRYAFRWVKGSPLLCKKCKHYPDPLIVSLVFYSYVLFIRMLQLFVCKEGHGNSFPFKIDNLNHYCGPLCGDQRLIGTDTHSWKESPVSAQNTKAVLSSFPPAEKRFKRN